MTIVAESFSYVIGADTHAKTHTLAAIEANTGAQVDNRTFPTTAGGVSRGLAWIKRRINSTGESLVVIEGIGS